MFITLGYHTLGPINLLNPINHMAAISMQIVCKPLDNELCVCSYTRDLCMCIHVYVYRVTNENVTTSRE